MELRGAVVSGLGRGADYVGMEAYQVRFADVLGFAPYPGTLNLRVDVDGRRRLQEAVDASRIAAFTVDGERYSGVDVYPVRVEDEAAALLDLDVTDHPDAVAELVAPVNLRDALGVADGDTVTVRPR